MWKVRASCPDHVCQTTSFPHDKADSPIASFRSRNAASPDVEHGQFAPASSISRSPSRASSKLILQKDKVIESLRLELAEAQIKLVEMENMGGGRMQEIEKMLLETRMTNARLMEDIDSYQLLLGERTLNGDFTKVGMMHDDIKPSGAGSLEDELNSAEEEERDTEKAPETEKTKRLEGEVKSMRDQNKALTLYIEKIIGRVLQHEGFEAILDKDPTLFSGPKAVTTEKELPPPPPPKDTPEKPLDPASAETQETETAPSLLQRAKSVVSGQSNRPKPKIRPFSQLPPAHEDVVSGPHENPETAPSIPLGRSTSTRGGPGHRRARSDLADPSAAAVVSQMYRGPRPGISPPAGQISPGISSPRQSGSFFPLPTGNPVNLSVAARSVSGPTERVASSSASTVSDLSGQNSTVGTSSPPRSSAGSNAIPGAVMTQNKLRPLRLVQESKEQELEDDAARKRANRGSWMGWFNRGKDDSQPSPGLSRADTAQM